MTVSQVVFVFFFQAEDGIRDGHVTGVQTCALPISFVAATSPAPPGRGGQGGSSSGRGGGSVGGPVGEPGAADAWIRSEERRVGKECRYGGVADADRAQRK